MTLQTQVDHILKLADGKARELKPNDGHPASWHLWKTNEVNAVVLALAAQRPLLVRGEPGTGKSQLARAAAQALGWALHTHTLHARSEPQDLLYRFDAVKRLADSQANGSLDDLAYWEPQGLWKSLNWTSAKQYGSLRNNDNLAPAGNVILIDEIDKAPSDVPNGLLDVMGSRRFDIPGLPSVYAQTGDKASWPLVIITTNEERDMPPAFLRRCVVLTHDREPIGGYRQFLIDHGNAHFGPGRGADCAVIDPSLLADAADQLISDRDHAIQAQLAPPGLAEYLDLLTAMHNLAPGDMSAQSNWLLKLNQYAFLKHRVEGASALTQTSGDKRPLAKSLGKA